MTSQKKQKNEDLKINYKKSWKDFGKLLEMNLEHWKDEELSSQSPGPWWVLWKSWIYLKKGTYPKGNQEYFDKEFTDHLIKLFQAYEKSISSRKELFVDEDSRNIYATTLGNIYMNSIISFSVSILDLILLNEPGSTKEWRGKVIARMEKAEFGNEMFRERLYDAIEWFSKQVSDKNQPIPKGLFYTLCDNFKGGDLCTWKTLKPLFTDLKQI